MSVSVQSEESFLNIDLTISYSSHGGDLILTELFLIQLAVINIGECILRNTSNAILCRRVNATFVHMWGMTLTQQCKTTSEINPR